MAHPLAPHVRPRWIKVQHVVVHEIQNTICCGCDKIVICESGREILILTVGNARKGVQKHMKPESMIDWVILIFVGAALIPEAITTVLGVDTSSWGAAGTLWDLLPIIMIAGAILAFQFKRSQSRKG